MWPSATPRCASRVSVPYIDNRGTEKSFKWRPFWDQDRDVICTAFGLDFGSIISHATVTESTTKASLHKPSRHSQGQKRAELKESQETLQQRISVYLQRELSAALPGLRVMRFKSGVLEISNH
jgi:hypothetical protein